MINPAYFDIIGLLVFSVLLFLGIKLRDYKEKTLKKIGLVLILIGISGLVVDLYNVVESINILF